MATARKFEAFTCNAEYEKMMLDSVPTPFEPTDKALKEAQKLLRIKPSKKRKVRRDLFEKMTNSFGDESGALLGRC